MRKADDFGLQLLLFLKFTYSENIEEDWAMFPILRSFEEKMMYSIKSMHQNADYWDLTSTIVGILAKIIRVFFLYIFPKLYLCYGPHSRCIGSICRQLLTYWYYRRVMLGFRSRKIPASWTVSDFPSVCGAAAVIRGNFTCVLIVVCSLWEELQLRGSPSQTGNW